MAGIALLLDVLGKKSGISGTAALHSYGSIAATAAASAAAASFAAGRPFGSRFLFGDGGMRVAYCDAGAELTDNDIFNLRAASEKVFQYDTLKYSTKEYPIRLKPLFSAFGLRSLSLTTLRAFLTYYLPLLEPKLNIEDDDDFPDDSEEERPVNYVDPFRKSIWQIMRETSVLTVRRVLERLAVHYVSHRIAWKLLKDVPESATRKAQRGLPSMLYIYSVSKTTFRGHLLGVCASWFVQVGIDLYRFFSSIFAQKEEEEVDRAAQVKFLQKRVSSVTIRCGSSLIFASIGAGIGAVLIRPSTGQWIGCAVGDLGGPIIVSAFFDRVLHIAL